jgi:SAM-dependent methyltransferase
MDARAHWEQVYRTRGDAEVSWTQVDPRISLAMIREVASTGSVIDVGGGTSPLAGRLLDAGYEVAVLDISEAALGRARQRLGEHAGRVRWINADVTEAPDLGRFDVWHDRAVFHFLTEPPQRQAYLALLTKTVAPGGGVVIGTFAPDGPERCSGLPVQRWSPEALAAELGEGLELLRSEFEEHITPTGARQSFQFSMFRRR